MRKSFESDHILSLSLSLYDFLFRFFCYLSTKEKQIFIGKVRRYLIVLMIFHEIEVCFFFISSFLLFSSGVLKFFFSAVFFFSSLSTVFFSFLLYQEFSSLFFSFPRPSFLLFSSGFLKFFLCLSNSLNF